MHMIYEDSIKQVELHESTTPNCEPDQYELWQAVLIKSGSLWCKVYSNSMRPLMYRGDTISIQNMDSNGVRQGDIVVFKKDNSWITHRIIGLKRIKNHLYYIEKGDANLNISHIDHTSVIGIVRKIRNRQGLHDVSRGKGRICQMLLTGVSLAALYFGTVSGCIRLLLFKQREWRGLQKTFCRFFTLIRIMIVFLFQGNKKFEEIKGFSG